MSRWQTICDIEDIPVNTGRCALLGHHQVAVFRVREGEAEYYYAIDNRDPFSSANVLSHGIVGSVDDQVVVASPIYKQHFCLRNGKCLEDSLQLRTWKVRVRGSHVQLSD